MKKSFLFMLLLAILHFGCSHIRSTESQTNWGTSAENLKAGLEIDNPALQCQVIKNIMFNMGQLNMHDLAVPLHRLATSAPDPELRELADLALLKMEYLYGDEFLQEKIVTADLRTNESR